MQSSPKRSSALDNIINNLHYIYRSLLKTALKEISESDVMATANESFRQKHERSVQKIKRILFIFYGFNLLNATFVYLPHRADVLNSYSMTPCFGRSSVFVVLSKTTMQS